MLPTNCIDDESPPTYPANPTSPPSYITLRKPKKYGQTMRTITTVSLVIVSFALVGFMYWYYLTISQEWQPREPANPEISYVAWSESVMSYEAMNNAEKAVSITGGLGQVLLDEAEIGRTEVGPFTLPPRERYSLIVSVPKGLLRDSAEIWPSIKRNMMVKWNLKLSDGGEVSKDFYYFTTSFQ